jgi:hypothetical protein
MNVIYNYSISYIKEFSFNFSEEVNKSSLLLGGYDFTYVAKIGGPQLMPIGTKNSTHWNVDLTGFKFGISDKNKTKLNASYAKFDHNNEYIEV